jgi:ATP-dependent RNA helicase DHX8/PRP22
MTGGILQRECLIDPDMSVYFFKCLIFTIPSRTYPVEILYTKAPESDYLDASLITIMQVHLSESLGDIPLLLTRQEEIDTACQILCKRMKALDPQVPGLLILPVYSALPSEMQGKVFDPAPPRARTVVIATNIAKTSITIDGIHYAIDPGFVKQNAYDPRLGMDSLVVTVSTLHFDSLMIFTVIVADFPSASQPAGRSSQTYGSRKVLPTLYRGRVPKRNVAFAHPRHPTQKLVPYDSDAQSHAINDLINFRFMDPPAQTLLTALEQLSALSALDDKGLLTRLGRKMAGFPMELPLAKMLITSVDLQCAEEIPSVRRSLDAARPLQGCRHEQQW